MKNLPLAAFHYSLKGCMMKIFDVQTIEASRASNVKGEELC
jgi:hypothetical protein